MIHQATVGIQPMTRLSPIDHLGKGHPMGIHETKEIEQGWKMWTFPGSNVGSCWNPVRRTG